VFNQTTSGDISNSPTTPRQQALELIKEEVKRLHPKVSREKLNELVQEEIQRLATIEPTELPRNIHEPSVRLTLGRNERPRITPVGERQDIVWGPPPPGQPSFRAGTVRPSDVTPLPADISSDPADILGQQHERQILQFQNESTQNESLLREQTDNRLRTLQEEFRIKADAMRQKYESIPLQQRTEEVNRRAQQEWDNLVRDMNLASTRIEGKIRPDLQRLQLSAQQDLQNLREKQFQDNLKLQTYKELADEGKLDPDEYKALTLRLAGIDVPLSYLREETPEQRFSEIERALRIVQGEIDLFTVSPEKYWGLTGGELQFTPTGYREDYRRASESEKSRYGELQAAKSDLQMERAEILDKMYPQYQGAFRKSTRLSGLARRQTKRRREGEPGTFAEGVIEAKNKAIRKTLSKERPIGKKQLTSAVVDKYLQFYNGDLTQAIAAAKMEGYAW